MELLLISLEYATHLGKFLITPSLSESSITRNPYLFHLWLGLSQERIVLKAEVTNEPESTASIDPFSQGDLDYSLSLPAFSHLLLLYGLFL